MTRDDGNGNEIHGSVREYYRKAVRSERAEPTEDRRWGANRYDDEYVEQDERAAALSMGCGNPYLMADLAPGEVVLDLGSGAGLDVILSARRVGPTGMAYGLDFLEEMIEEATANVTEAGLDNVEFLHGMIEDVPLPDDSVDVVISNCVINLAPDKAPVFREIARVLRPGGRVAVSDVLAEVGHVATDDGTAWADCGAGALPHDRYLDMLAEAGLIDVSITPTHVTGPGLSGATIRATLPDSTA